MSDDPRDNKDDDTTPIKPLMLTGIVLMSAGAGLVAGLLTCWLFCCKADSDGSYQRSVTAVATPWVAPG